MSNSIKKAVGLDISDYSIEILELIQNKDGFSVSGLNRYESDKALLRRGRIIAAKQLAKLIKELLVSAKPSPIICRDIVFGLPENQVYTHIFRTNATDKIKLRKEVQKEAQSYFPASTKKLIYIFKVVAKKNNEQTILLKACNSKFLNDWYNFFKKAGLNLRFFDLEALASYRGMFKQPSKQTVCLIDFGAHTTNLNFFNPLGLVFAHTLHYGGQYITKKIAEKLKIDLINAENLKLTQGLNEQVRSGRVIKSILKHLANEIKRNIVYYDDKYKEKVTKVIFYGGSSKITGLVDFFKEQNISADIQLGKSYLDKDLEPEYIKAIGLARRCFDGELDQGEIYFPVPKKASLKGGIKVYNLQRGLREKTKKIKQLQIKNILTAFIIFIFLCGFLFLWITRTNKLAAPEINNNPLPPIVAPPAESIEAPAVIKKRIIRVVNISGSLNIRSGPGLNFPVIATAYSGDEFELVEEKESWLKIIIKNNNFGWVFSNFTETIE